MVCFVNNTLTPEGRARVDEEDGDEDVPEIIPRWALQDVRLYYHMSSLTRYCFETVLATR